MPQDRTRQRQTLATALAAVLVLLALLPLAAPADTVRARFTDGSVIEQSGVTVESYDADSGSIAVRLANGSTQRLPLAQAERISFGEAGEGAVVNISVGMFSDVGDYPGTVLFEFSGGQFRARPPDEAEEYFLAPAVVRGFTRTGGAPPPPPAPGQPDPFGEMPGFDEDDEMASDPSEEGLSREELVRRRVEEAFARGAAGRTPLDAEFDAKAQAAGKTALIFGALLLVYFALYITTLIWMVVFAFKNSYTGWGVGLLLSTVCFAGCLIGAVVSNTPVKGLFLGKYDGPAKGVLNALVITEIIIYIAFFFLKEVLTSQMKSLMGV